VILFGLATLGYQMTRLQAISDVLAALLVSRGGSMDTPADRLNKW